MQHFYRALVLTSIFFCFQSLSAYGSGRIGVRNLIATTLLPGGEVSVPATCFLAGELCNVDEVLINISDGSPVGSQPPVVAGPSLFLDCSYRGAQPVNIWVLSNSGQWTAYETALFVQDNFEVCNNGSIFDAPSLQVIQGLAYGIDGSGETLLYASDFVSAYTLPNGGSPVFSFSSDPADTVRVLDCNSPETNVFEIHIHDGQAGSSTYVVTYALLTDEAGLCASGGAGQSFPVLNGLAYTLPETGRLTVSVTDFLTCCPNDSLTYAFSPDPADQYMTIDCDDGIIPNFASTFLVAIHGIEPGGSYSVSSTYFQLFDLYGYCSQGAFQPANDEACNATPLTISSCSHFGANINATAQPDEPAPPNGACDAPDAWCDEQGAENSVWYRFEAPASGSVSIHTRYFNTQLALWEADSCQAITGGNAILVAANDDDPGSSRGEAALEGVACLIPGKTYYLQVDGYEGETGNFELLLEDAGISCGLAEGTADCMAASTLSVSSGGNIWRHAFDASGGLIASVADDGNSLGDITVEYQINEGDIRLDGAGAPYLDRNWSITVDAQPAGPVRLRLYFTQAEFQALQGGGAGIETPAHIALTRVMDGTCGPYSNGGELIAQEGYGMINDTDYYMDFLIPGFSAFYLHGPEPLVSGLSDKTGEAAMRIMPNPVRGEAVLQAVTAQASEASLALFDARGYMVSRREVVLQEGENRLPLLLGALPSGIYFARLIGQELNWSSKLIVR